MTNTLSEVGDYLSNRQEYIVDRWMQACELDGTLGVIMGRLAREDFRNNIPASIAQLNSIMSDGCSQQTANSVRCEVAKHGHHRWKQGFSLRELIRDWGNLNRVLISVIDEFYQERPELAADMPKALDRLAEFMTEATSNSVKRFDELRQAEASGMARELGSVKNQFEKLTEARAKILREAAHDIRGGLSTIAGASAVLKFAKDHNTSLDEMLATLDSGVETVKDMLNALLDLSRLESGAEDVELSTVDLTELFEHLVAEQQGVASMKGLTLITEGPPKLMVRTDAGKVRRITQNLLSNALEYTPSGEVHISWRAEEKQWVLVVRDTGSGMQNKFGSPVAQEMDQPDLETQPTRPEGPQAYAGEGIGLTIVKRLCELLEAGISLQSEIGKGTTFTLSFPMDYAE